MQTRLGLLQPIGAFRAMALGKGAADVAIGKERNDLHARVRYSQN